MGKIFALKKSNKLNKASVPAKSKKKVSKEEPRDDYKQHHRMDSSLVACLKPNSFEAEQFRMLRTNILFPISGKSPRSIMVTSADLDEGKSFVASNLAISIAQIISEHVLLIDCDLRSPCIHTRFGLSDTPGLSEYLSHGSHFEGVGNKFGDIPELSEVLSDGVFLTSLFVPTKIDKLTILPAGKPPHNPSELLASKQMSELIKKEKTRYSNRYIIIDAPPPKLMTESSVLSRQVDGVIIVVKYGSTPRKLVSDLIDILGKEKVIGIVFNCFDGYGKYDKFRKKWARLV
ncbi:exopolysaccharide biosynthesis protein [Desulfobacterales bacterium HSG2]|nr:exopolysaccharide biosynthesis protein [Desulfobacterales bacterium HSG2]